MSPASNGGTTPQPVVVDGQYVCLHRWVHIPERDWTSGLNGQRVRLLFFCEQCLAIETRTVERSGP